jgi:pyrroloquinoline-quinone synthase
LETSEREHRANVRAALAGATARKRLLDHPFYQAWSAGTLSRSDLALYAAQYQHVVTAFSELLARAFVTLEEPEHRRAVAANLADEMGVGGPSHPELWQQFADAVGASRRDGESRLSAPLPKVADAIERLRQAVGGTAPRAVAALWAIESQAPSVSEAKLAGLKDHLGTYGVPEGPGTAYFQLHATLDREHAAEEEQMLAGLVRGPEDLAEARRGAAEGAAALWSVLDGVASAIGLSCAM